MPHGAAAIIVAAGRGTRLSANPTGLAKQYLPLAGRPLLSHTLDVFLGHPEIACILVVIRDGDENHYQAAADACLEPLTSTLVPPVMGGETRQESVRNGLLALKDRGCDSVLIHDAARPFVSHAVIDGVLETLAGGAQGALAAVPVVDTLKRQTGNDQRLKTVDRADLWAAQTPQGFAYQQILDAHNRAAASGLQDFTDDTSLAEWAGMHVALSPGEPDNIKITTSADLQRAQRMLRQMPEAQTSDDYGKALAQLPDVRVGTGYDVHAFEDGDAVILGGVAIEHTRRLKGHSDADVVLHAITDATLGAIADGDIGQHFPPSDPQWKGAASDQFQQHAMERVTNRGGMISHIDVTVVCEAPKIGPHRDAIRDRIAGICSLPVSRVSVKATTSEELGFTGRREGIAALASVTVRLPL